MQRLVIRHGDCIQVMQSMADGEVGHVVSDPPYDLTAVSRGGSHRVAGTGPYGRHTLDTKNPVKGFMGKTWDGTGIAFSDEFWGEVFRVVRSGGVVKAFSGTRTFHRMTAAMRRAGFVDFQMDAWAYGSGFPKSLNVGKKLAQMGDREASELWVGWGTALKPAWEPVVVCRKP